MQKYYYDPKISHYEGYKDLVKKYTDVLRTENKIEENNSRFGNVETEVCLNPMSIGALCNVG